MFAAVFTVCSAAGIAQAQSTGWPHKQAGIVRYSALGFKTNSSGWTLEHSNEFPPAAECSPSEVQVDKTNAAEACGLKCRSTEQCAFFWVYTAGASAGKCFLKAAVEPGPLVKPSCTTCGGEWYQMGGLKTAIAEVSKSVHNPLFQQDTPWEVRIDNGYPNVHLQSGPAGPEWQLWYGTCTGTHSCSHQVLLYANSTDGLKWNKPSLGKYDLASLRSPYGSALAKYGTRNNIVLYGGGLGVYRDPHEANASKRFKISGGAPAGCYSADGTQKCVKGTAASPDGIGSWTDVTALDFPPPARLDCHTNLFFDDRRQEYVMTTREYVNNVRDIGITTTGSNSSGGGGRYVQY
jgi:hypothetical protein